MSGEPGEVFEYVDEWELTLRQWVAHDRIQRQAERLIVSLDLDPALASRLRAAAADGDDDAFFEVVADLLRGLE